VRSWNAAVLACCRRGPFRVAFAGIDANGLFAHVYSSESDAWGEAASAPLPVPGPGDAERLDEFLLPVPGAQVGYGFYFVLGKKGSAVLEYDPAARALAVIPLPELPYRALIALMALEGGGVLGFAEVDLQSTLRLWAAETDPAAAAAPGQLWVVRRAIHLATQLPAHVSSVYYVVASADGAGVVFLCTTDGLYTFDLNSGQSTRVMSNRFYDIIPYVTFYTPGTVRPYQPHDELIPCLLFLYVQHYFSPVVSLQSHQCSVRGIFCINSPNGHRKLGYTYSHVFILWLLLEFD
jgi:hypothetical protein